MKCSLDPRNRPPHRASFRLRRPSNVVAFHATSDGIASR